MASKTLSPNPLVGRMGYRPRLTAEAERELAISYRSTGNIAAYHKLIEMHLPLVVAIVRRHCLSPASFADLVQEGTLGLIRAVQKFEPERGIRLSTYATAWIKAFVFQHGINNRRIMRMATTAAHRKLFYALRKEQARLKANGESTDAAVLAKALDVSVADVVEMEGRLSGNEVPFDDVVADCLAADATPVDEMLVQCETQRAVSQKLRIVEKSLNERDRAILQHRFVAEKPTTLHELGKRWSISRERVRQVESKLKTKLQAHFAPLEDTNSLEDVAA